MDESFQGGGIEIMLSRIREETGSKLRLRMCDAISGKHISANNPDYAQVCEA